MDKTYVIDRIIKILMNNGIIFKLEDELTSEIDSLAFVSLIVDIENEFNISIPDESFLDDSFRSVNGLAEVVLKLTNC